MRRRVPSRRQRLNWEYAVGHRKPQASDPPAEQRGLKAREGAENAAAACAMIGSADHSSRRAAGQACRGAQPERTK
jgi:hypothetical protein